MSQNGSFLVGRDEQNIKNVSNQHLVVCLIYYTCKNISIQMQVLLTTKDFSLHLSKRNSPCLHDAGPRLIDHPMSPVFRRFDVVMLTDGNAKKRHHFNKLRFMKCNDSVYIYINNIYIYT